MVSVAAVRLREATHGANEMAEGGSNGPIDGRGHTCGAKPVRT